ncbi:NO-inducible flavohemoprotein [Oceanobacillus halophilus]|uniref:Flavohemoprotein n=1 Tax=Oceanobacillus halophilus TaxID=930130 RepID=A0A495ACA4_9BACI|nr:NO-inducible flavohemoprotein [Oceanobacillus halophilus]RKQ37596.1 NO-inducible flavohemoprotein [Oceanobacillus halophilus]
MLDDKTVEIVQSTAPVLKEHSKEIGLKFYELLFSKAPELYNLFNQTNQKLGIQQEALAYSVYAAGEHITNLDAIMPVITRVTEKHRAIGVRADQYPLVGETLLEAVKDVLGETATDETMDAWGKAYNYIADAFIEIENKLYEEAREQPGGWDGFRAFTVQKKEPESKEVTSFYLVPADGKKIATYQPGQYITVKARIPGEEYTHIRHYSISDAPGKNYYRISVKREDASNNAPEGIVSNFLHEQINEGDSIDISAPAGDFVQDNQEQDFPLVLISGGIGITPLISMLNTVTVEQPEREVIFIHATTNSQTHAFKDHVKQLAESHSTLKSIVCYDAPTDVDRNNGNFDKEGFIDLDLIRTFVPNKDAMFYFCGPIPFMKAINGALQQWDVNEEHIHFEVFNPIAILGTE